MFKHFKGRIFQVIDALDYGDAVSNQVLAMHELFGELGLESAIHARFCHDSLRSMCRELEQLRPGEADVVILHYSLYSEFAAPYVAGLRCTRILHYHNITPHTFFDEGTRIRKLCEDGRTQLQAIARNYHFCWGDSAYNLEELQAIGVPAAQCAVIPIAVREAAVAAGAHQQEGEWVFLGRVAGNKGQRNLLRQFARLRQEYPQYARKLTLIGGYDLGDSYAQALFDDIADLQLGGVVEVTGKVPDAEVAERLSRAALYVSMSEHEGFGVPLIEAAHYRLPVLALRNTAVGETMGGVHGLADHPQQLAELVVQVLSDPARRARLVAAQQENARRFLRPRVLQALSGALAQVLPQPGTFNSVSVVICTYNRDTLLARCLDYLEHQTDQRFEVVVVNGPSTDGTEQVIARYNGRIKVGYNPERNLSKSRNIGIELADGDLVAFIDDDAIPFDDWIETLLREFNAAPLSVAGLGGPAYYAGSLDFQAEDNAVNKFAEAWVNISADKVGRDGWMRYPTGTNCCFRTDILRAEGGFDEQYDYYLDESELCFRLQAHGYLIAYAKDLYLRHEFAQSHNRSGKYNYNWFTICKNTAYFIAAYSGLQGQELQAYLEQRSEKERIDPLRRAAAAGEITLEERDRYIEAIQRGFQQGLADARHHPRIRTLHQAPGKFLAYGSGRAAALPMEQQRLHICILSKEFPPFVPGGGIGTLYYHLASELLLMGHYVSVIAPSKQSSVYRRGRFAVRYVGTAELCTDSGGAQGFARNASWSMSAFAAIAELHRERPVDVIDSALWDSEALALTLVPATQRPPLVVRLVTPFGVSAHFNQWETPARESALLRGAEKSLIDQAQSVIAISASIADTVQREHQVQRDARWTVSHCGIAYWPFFDVNGGYASLGARYEQLLESALRGKMVLFVGRLEGRKGVDLLLEAAQTFLARDPEIHLVVAGRDVEGWEARFTAHADERLAQRVIFLGAVEDGLRDKLMNAAYCLVFPSRYESFGLVPLEAFVHKLPVIASRSGAIPEVVSHEHSGLLFEEGNAAALAAAVLRLSQDRGYRDQLARGAEAQIRKFSSRAMAIASVNIYRKLLT